MRTILIFISIFFSLFCTVQGDVYVRGTLHIPGGYRYGHNVPDLNVSNEWWFGTDKLTFTSTGWQLDYLLKDWRFTLDKTEGKILVVNLNDEFYVEASLSADLSSLIEGDGNDRLRNYLIDGRTRNLEIKESVLQRECDVFEVTEWIEEGDDHFYERDRRIKTSTDVPFNWTMAHELYRWIRSFFNPRPGYLSGLADMEGFILEEDVKMYELAGRMEWSFIVEDMIEREAPHGIWAPPPGFKKKNKFSFRDLREMLAILFPAPIY